MAYSHEYGYPSSSESRWNPKNWSRRIWLIVCSAIIVVVIVIVAAVVGVNATKNNSKSSSYPDYTKLNYTLLDTCELDLTEVVSGKHH